jgi:hypothetical protein
MCALGDAYRELGRPKDAAPVYKWAIELNPGAPCSDYYAKLVLDHNLDEFYGHAATSLRQNRVLWRQRPLRTRMFAMIVTLLSSPRALFRFWHDHRQTNHRVSELQRRADERREAL